jgi:hypothetical protein
MFQDHPQAGHGAGRRGFLPMKRQFRSHAFSLGRVALPVLPSPGTASSPPQSLARRPRPPCLRRLRCRREDRSVSQGQLTVGGGADIFRHLLRSIPSVRCTSLRLSTTDFSNSTDTCPTCPFNSSCPLYPLFRILGATKPHMVVPVTISAAVGAAGVPLSDAPRAATYCFHDARVRP